MNIILGATGQIGTMLVDNLLEQGQPVKAVIRNYSKAQELKNKGVEVFITDSFEVEALKKAFHGGSSVFLLTPKNRKCENFLNETQMIINNYREAILSSGITKVVGLSSVGAQHKSETGNLVASYMLEHAFSDLKIEQIFIRPTYYFSNWLGYLELVKEHGILPTFFPPGMELPMIAPSDVARFLSKIMICETSQEKMYEITGPHSYNSSDIAKIFEDVLNRDVILQQLLPEEWESTLIQAGFSIDGAKNSILMTKAVIDGKTKYDTTNPIRFSTDFKKYLRNVI
ncbi:NmrA family NAD(P)-binding protein [Clostridium botulinum]|uniref:NmrA family NAD(P)-binding protein n=1 Tax=Clostridium botulinum TaxID=1491 RepID=UPI00137613C0|nr:NmrA family NAD(P)-binding protein [Clostridium botulinum]NCI19069.1 NmrA family NAD(P)-binding protein [Clostridium botulinum]NCI35481.1 NmrA family NAD(P)-binding protein [Clostridium botulinum]NCI72676.1 NmrA family NAD(P)-binding protein [Clostridium botulinum]NDI38033.1 NmrA family NAD(P)-binding protein [Clostridium botulinum]